MYNLLHQRQQDFYMCSTSMLLPATFVASPRTDFGLPAALYTWAKRLAAGPMLLGQPSHPAWAASRYEATFGRFKVLMAYSMPAESRQCRSVVHQEGQPTRVCGLRLRTLGDAEICDKVAKTVRLYDEVSVGTHLRCHCRASDEECYVDIWVGLQLGSNGVNFPKERR